MGMLQTLLGDDLTASERIDKGLRRGIHRGIQTLIETCKELNCTWEMTVQKI